MGITYNTSIVRSGLVLHLDAANKKSYPSSGSTVFDLSPFRLDFTLYNGASFQENPSRFSFDGVDDNLGKAAPSELQLKNDKTIIFWWRHNSVGGEDSATLIRVGLGLDLLYCLFSDRSTKALTFHWYESAFKSVSSNTNVFNLDSFNFGATVISGTTCNFYVNGTICGSGSVTVPSPASASNIGIGASRAGVAVGTTAQDFAGDISQVQIYNRALTAQEVRQNFEASRDRYGL